MAILENENNSNHVFQFVDFSKASSHAIECLLGALNKEVDEAVAQKRFPTLDGAFNRLGTSIAMQI